MTRDEAYEKAKSLWGATAFAVEFNSHKKHWYRLGFFSGKHVEIVATKESWEAAFEQAG